LQLTGPALQQSDVDPHAPPTPTQLIWLTSTHCPCSQNPEQHSKPAPHAPPVVPAGTLDVQLASAQKPRMFGVFS
jgi:hypothetical protein